MGKFASRTDEVLYRLTLDGPDEIIGDVNTWGAIHLGLGRVTRNELATQHADVLAEVGVSAEDIPDGRFWIVKEDDQGFVDTTAYATESAYTAALEEYERAFSEFEAAS